MTITKVPLLGLKADQFRHLDLEAILAFKQLPGWDWLVLSILGPAEQALYFDNIGSYQTLIRR
jgi:hypothetical protein